MEKAKQLKLGHQAPKEFRVNEFNYIELTRDLIYCKEGNFVYSYAAEQEKLHNGLPCIYTDTRFNPEKGIHYYNHEMFWNRRKAISLKACMRRARKCFNIPVGTLLTFKKSWYVQSKNKKVVNGSFLYKVRKENKKEITYEVNTPRFFTQFPHPGFAQELCDALRVNGFLVDVGGMEYYDGTHAVAYGHGKVIGFSDSNTVFGYGSGAENVLWDQVGWFDKWSKCDRIPETTPIPEILAILMAPNRPENEDGSDHIGFLKPYTG
jgi:hypothetical protein